MKTISYASNEAKWRAVRRKSRRADGHFVFSVKTTGIYCRPSCSSTQALRENVAFHATPAEAEQAGFRACKRCQPGGPSVAEDQARLIARACRAIEHAEEEPSLADLARAAHLSRFHFHRLFKRVAGMTPKAFARAQRSRRVRRELCRRPSVTDAIYASGFNSSSRFYRESRRMLGMKPADFRRGGTRETIRFAIARCSLGLILVAASNDGVCAVLLGDDRAELKRDLQRRFSRAWLEMGGRDFSQTVRAVIRFVEKPRLGLDLPLDLRGTAFQERVWQALRRIPVGTTTTYARLAASIGASKASRAVGAACAANPVAVAVPCHRVVPTGSSMIKGEYRWGAKRKEALLAREIA